MQDRYWDESDDAAQSADQQPDLLPPGLHWVKIVRTNSYQKEGDVLPTVVVNFAELEPLIGDDGKPKLPREHAHFERFSTDPHRMKYVIETLKALGASEEVRKKSKRMHDFLVDAPEKCRKYKYQIEITESEGRGGRTFLNAKILQETAVGSDPGATAQPEGWDDWGSKKKNETPDDDVQF